MSQAKKFHSLEYNIKKTHINDYMMVIKVSFILRELLETHLVRPTPKPPVSEEKILILDSLTIQSSNNFSSSLCLKHYHPITYIFRKTPSNVNAINNSL